ncbi:hypothetical protein ACN6AT_37245 (plasmid) [Streptomyces sp. JL4002]|uniref:hypothetical protein n=1 Tax=Streptomyces sp. JL4002 TaxID=3404781 RepID=UPI003B2812C3
MKVSQRLSAAVPLAVMVAGAAAGTANAGGGPAGEGMFVVCQSPSAFSLVDTSGGAGGLIGQTASGLGLGLLGAGQGESGHPKTYTTTPTPEPTPENNGGTASGQGNGGSNSNSGSADGGNGGHTDLATNQNVSGNRCLTGDETNTKVTKDDHSRLDTSTTVDSHNDKSHGKDNSRKNHHGLL